QDPEQRQSVSTDPSLHLRVIGHVVPYLISSIYRQTHAYGDIPVKSNPLLGQVQPTGSLPGGIQPAGVGILNVPPVHSFVARHAVGSQEAAEFVSHIHPSGLQSWVHVHPFPENLYEHKQ
ncbi:MAG: hypothetical protein EZS28_042279, partial [Streblomastix strix]